MIILKIWIHFPLQGDEGFPGFPGPKVMENIEFSSAISTEVANYSVTLYTLANGPSFCCRLFALSFLPLFQGEAGGPGTKGGPGRRGNHGQRVSFQTPLRLSHTEHSFLNVTYSMVSLSKIPPTLIIIGHICICLSILSRVSLEILVHLDRRERLDILGLM